ncbi:protein translocase subunit SecD [Candidatus Campbellbacteria bacterium]|nr:MAG: protein translocase subunit SecD [Candidatus Campbellbacteria bacterium]
MKYKIWSLVILVIVVFLGYFYLIKPEMEYENFKRTYNAEKKELLSKIKKQKEKVSENNTSDKQDKKIGMLKNEKTEEKKVQIDLTDKTASVDYQKELIQKEQKLNDLKSKTFHLGLDLVGGSQLEYDAIISELKPQDVEGSLEALKTVLEKRLNPFGTSEVVVVIEDSSVFAENQDTKKRVVIQIPGVSNPDEAKKMIGKIPTLDFRLFSKDLNDFVKTELTGRYLKTATLSFDGQTNQPVVALKFTDEGAKIFEKLTAENVGEVMGVFLDGVPITTPRINQKISGNQAVIEGDFTAESAKELAQNMQFGALPIPIELVSSNTVSATLGKDILNKGVQAAVIGFILVSIFLILIYKISGVIATVALFCYLVLTLTVYKAFGFVFTAASIAGFIISIGMAVDANVLIFERIKDELKTKTKIKEAVENGFKRAWLSIRDGNISSIITAIILFYLTTSLIQGFALTFGLGVLVSMLTAIVLTRTFLLSITPKSNKQLAKKIYFGFNNKKK